MIETKERVMNTTFKLIALCILLTSFAGCYRMPEPDEYSLIPATNNRDYTRETGSNLPSIGY